MKRSLTPLLIVLFVSFFLLKLPAAAQNSRKLIVSQHHPNSSDSNSGTSTAPFQTISQAAQLAQAGDTIVVHEGIYRERVAPVRGGTAEQPIVYVAAVGEKVIIKGSDEWKPAWEAIEPNIYLGKWDTTAFVTNIPKEYGFSHKQIYFNPYQESLLREPYDRQLSLGQLFVEGVPLLEVDSLTQLRSLPGSWMVNEESDGLYVHFPDSQSPSAFELVELTARPRVFAPFRRGLAYIHVIGFRMEHGATNFPSGFWSEQGYPQAGIVSCRGGHHWKIEDCTIRFGKSLGLDIGSEGFHDADGLGQGQPEGSGYHVIRNNTISDNGCGGIAGIRSTASDISFNQIERNNRLGFTAPEVGGIKLHFFVGGTIEGNLVRDNYAYGIWLDNEWHESRVTRNVVVGNEKAGIFMELGFGPILIDHNIIAYNQAYSGYGLYSHDASGVTFAHNLVYFNAGFGLWAHVATDRTKDYPDDSTAERVQVTASNWKVLNNIFMGNDGAISFPLESDISENNYSDYNILSGGYDRLTYETFAESLDAPLFLINTNKGRSSTEQWLSQMDKNFGSDTSSEAANFLGNRKMDIPYLNLEEWQTLTENDNHSQYSAILRPTFSSTTLLLSFYIDESINEVECPVIPEIRHDFFGTKMPEKPLPGPFQDIVFESLLNDRSQMLEYRGPYNYIRADNAQPNVWLVQPTELK